MNTTDSNINNINYSEGTCPYITYLSMMVEFEYEKHNDTIDNETEIFPYTLDKKTETFPYISSPDMME